MIKQTKIVENIKRTGVICSLWIISMFFYYLIIYFAVDEVSPNKIEFFPHIISGLILGLLLGLTNGFLEVFIFRKKFKRLKFGYTIILKTSLFISAFLATVIIFIIVKNYLLVPAGLFEKVHENEIVEFFGSSVFFKHGLYASSLQFWNKFLFTN